MVEIKGQVKEPTGTGIQWESIEQELLDKYIRKVNDDPLLKNEFYLEDDIAKEHERLREIVRKVEESVDEQFILHENDLEELHTQAESSDRVLENMEKLLSAFQIDLGNVSEDIQALQRQSISLTTRLENRKKLESRINIRELIIAPSLIQKISDGDVDETWLAYLLQLEQKLSTPLPTQIFIAACRDVQPELERLRLRASERIRDFFLHKIKTAQIPNANVQVLQQSTLVKYRALNHFVIKFSPDVAMEIRQNYVNTMKWYYQTHFERYMRALDRIEGILVEKSDFIGADPPNATASKTVPSFMPTKSATSLKDKGKSGLERIDVLKNAEAGVIVTHIAEEEGQKHPFEALFRSLNLAIVDNVSSEYMFLAEFFPPTASHQSSEAFYEIFESTLKSALTFTRQHIEASYDAIGILICIRLNTHFNMTLQNRKVPMLDSYSNATMMRLWPRFKAIVENHIESLRKAANRTMAKDTHAHHVTRQYAEFATVIYSLCESANEDVIFSSMSRLTQEFEAFLIKLSLSLTETTRPIFLINNYDMISTILGENPLPKAGQPTLDRFRDLLNREMTSYVTIALEPHFGFLLNSEERGALIMNIGREFEIHWKSRLRTMQTEILQRFSNFKIGQLLMQMCLENIRMRYETFMEVASNSNSNVPIVRMDQINDEFKRYQSVI